MPRLTTADRLARLDLLASRLKADEPMTATDIAAELGVSPRTLFRDLAILRDRGLPIEADRGRGGGVRLHRHWGIGRLNLNYAEAVGLLVSLAIAERLGSPWLIANLASVRRKLAASFAPALRDRIEALRARILIGRMASSPVLGTFADPESAASSALFESFLEQRLLSFLYKDGDGRPSRRVAEPHYLLLNYPVWYLVAFDQGKSAVRTFRCDRISAAIVQDQMFHLRAPATFAPALEGVADAAKQQARPVARTRR